VVAISDVLCENYRAFGIVGKFGDDAGASDEQGLTIGLGLWR